MCGVGGGLLVPASVVMLASGEAETPLLVPPEPPLLDVAPLAVPPLELLDEFPPEPPPPLVELSLVTCASPPGLVACVPQARVQHPTTTLATSCHEFQ
jgi:hypothetical protein